MRNHTYEGKYSNQPLSGASNWKVVLDGMFELPVRTDLDSGGDQLSWGFGGTGCRMLAISMLAVEFTPKCARLLTPEFLGAFVKRWPKDNDWSMSSVEIRRWAYSHLMSSFVAKVQLEASREGTPYDDIDQGFVAAVLATVDICNDFSPYVARQMGIYANFDERIARLIWTEWHREILVFMFGPDVLGTSFYGMLQRRDPATQTLMLYIDVLNDEDAYADAGGIEFGEAL